MWNVGAHHVDFVFIHEDAGTQQEGEEQFMLLKERPAHIAVQAEREVVVDILDALAEVIYM